MASQGYCSKNGIKLKPMTPWLAAFLHVSTVNRVGLTNGDPKITDRLRTLQSAMMRAGFSLLDREWWHFSDVGNGTLGAPVMAGDLGL